MKMDILCDLLDTHGVDAKEVQICPQHQVVQLFKWTLMVKLPSFFMVTLMLKMTRTRFSKVTNAENGDIFPQNETNGVAFLIGKLKILGLQQF